MCVKKLSAIIFEALPVLFMIWLVSAIPNDYLLTLMYIALIDFFFRIKKEPGEILVLVSGFFIMMLAETIFVATGAETFNRRSLFGIMPLWLPFLWAYGFVAIKRIILTLLPKTDVS